MVMKFLQKLGKSLMLPVACLPVCGILMGIGYALCPSTMQGGTVEGLKEIIGFFLVKAGGALIDNMSWLFAVGVAVGMSDDNDGTAGLAGLVSWLMMTKLLNPTAKLPDWLSFFSGKRGVAIVSALVSIVVAAVLFFVWPIVFGALVALGKGIMSLDAVGAGIYAFFNRLLIPFGLHHALNNVFWFDTIGIGDLTHFWAGETSADVTWSLGMYMAGFFPCMMFGIPGAALAMVQCAKKEKRKIVIGLVGSAAVAAFVCGVTEPFEFAFMFLAPVLYLVYSLLYGIFTTITVALGFRAGFSFSAGLTDLVFSAQLPAAAKTMLIIPLGAAAFVVFYLVFRVLITKLDLKTPGREDDDTESEKAVSLSNNNYTEVASIILEGLGGPSNVTSIDNCITRLRLEVKDQALVDEKKIKSAGIAGIIRPGRAPAEPSPWSQRPSGR